MSASSCRFFLSSFSRLQVIQNSAPSTIVWRQCDIQMIFTKCFKNSILLSGSNRTSVRPSYLFSLAKSYFLICILCLIWQKKGCGTFRGWIRTIQSQWREKYSPDNSYFWSFPLNPPQSCQIGPVSMNTYLVNFSPGVSKLFCFFHTKLFRGKLTKNWPHF